MSEPMIEKATLRVGVMPLADAAPLVVAAARGCFERAGLEVELVVEKSWAAIRDKLAIGLLDAAQMPAPMPLAATLGIDGMNVPMRTALSLNLNGNGISVSSSLYAQIAAQLDGADDVRGRAQALGRVIAARGNGAPLRLVCVHAFSKHHYELRQWLAAGGIDPDRDLRLGVMPPERMVTALAAGEIDGFCAGAPWSQVAIRQGVGMTVATSWQLWNNGPEKVLGVTRDWAERHPATHAALVSAVIEAARWLDVPEHRDEAARLLVDHGVIPAPVEALMTALRIESASSLLLDGGYVFHAGAAGMPWHSHARWFIEQMRRCGQLRSAVDETGVVKTTYRSDLYRQALQRLGLPVPRSHDKTENQHAGLWEMPAEPGVITMGPDLQLSP